MLIDCTASLSQMLDKSFKGKQGGSRGILGPFGTEFYSKTSQNILLRKLGDVSKYDGWGDGL